MVGAAQKYDFQIAEPYMKAGKLKPMGVGVPLATYFQVEGAGSFCKPASNHTRIKMKPDCAVSEPRWCGDRVVCVPAWYGCRRPSGSYDDIGHVIEQTRAFLKTGAPSTSYLLQTPADLWYHGVPLPGRMLQMRLVPDVMKMADSFEQRHVNCSSGPRVAAVARIAYAGGMQTTPHELWRSCNSTFDATNSALQFSMARWTQNSCSMYLASDWLAHADPTKGQRAQAVSKCWKEAILSDTSPRWWFIWGGDRTIPESAGDIPSMEQAAKKDPVGIGAILDVAMLVRADVCLESSHMGSTVASPIRSLMGKLPCYNVHSIGQTHLEMRIGQTNATWREGDGEMAETAADIEKNMAGLLASPFPYQSNY